MGILSEIGKPLSGRLRSFLGFNIFVIDTIRSLPKNFKYNKRIMFRNIAFQITFTAIDAIPLIMLISIFLFSALITQVHIFVPRIGAGLFVGKIFVILIIRELAPLLIALVVIARSGTAIAAELSSMRVNDEISSLKVLGINPLYFLVLPRVIGVTVSVVCLCFIFTVTTVLGGMLLANYTLNISINQYIDGVISSITPLDVLLNFVKALIFGLVISLVCCYYGLTTKYSPTEIPQVTTKAVINSLFWCFVFSAMITILYY